MRRQRRPRRILLRARKAAGIPDLDFGTCRRTFSTLIEGDVADIGEFLGHSAATMTLEHYQKAIPERQKAAVEALDRRLTKGDSSGPEDGFLDRFVRT